MQFNFVNVPSDHSLISNIWQMSIDSELTPFNTPLLSTGETFISFVFTNKPNHFKIDDRVYPMKGLQISGQIYGAISASYFDKSYDLGIIFKPTSFYKMFKVNMLTLTNNIKPLKEFKVELYEQLEPLFVENKYNMDKFRASVLEIFNEKSFQEDDKTKIVDKVISLINEKEGLITVKEINETLDVSQKTLENYFKKMIGLTPNKYLKQFRFISLLRRYQNNNMDLKELAKEFKYYDASHFTKDFNLFTGQTPKKYFGEEYPILNSLLS